MREQRHQTGSIVYDKRRGTWNFLQWVDGKRKSVLIGTLRDYPTKASAWRGAELHRTKQQPEATQNTAPNVNTLIEHYMVEKMPTRIDTRRTYTAWLNNHISPRWGVSPITDLQPQPVELWLKTLKLAPKSRAHVRGLLSKLWDFAMWRGDVPVQRNPMGLVTIKGSSKRNKKAKSLSVEEFQKFIVHLEEPFHTIALISVCFGLRISECMALRWSDVDWLNGLLCVERGIVAQIVDEVKTEGSRKQLKIDSAMLDVLKAWKQGTQFSAAGDWMFASPFTIGRLPWSYDQVRRTFVKAGNLAGVGHVSTHAMRHTYRSWLDSVGTSIAVQQKLMRHADIRTTMNTYGDVVTDEMAVASRKISQLALTDRTRIA